jgi:hypothetical protein
VPPHYANEINGRADFYLLHTARGHSNRPRGCSDPLGVAQTLTVVSLNFPGVIRIFPGVTLTLPGVTQTLAAVAWTIPG